MSAQTHGFASEYVALRNALLERIVAALRQDPRFVAAWLSGSFGRGEEDAYSDLDLEAVAGAPHYQRYARSVPLAPTPYAQAAAIRALCDELEALMPGLRQIGGAVPPAQRSLVERWLALLE